MDAVLFGTCVTTGFLALAVIAALALRRPLESFLDFVRSIPLWQRAFLMVFAVVFILYGGDKDDAANGSGAEPPCREHFCARTMAVWTGGSIESVCGLVPRLVLPDDLVVTNLMFFGFKGGTNVAFGLTWPVDDPFRSDYVNLYCKLSLSDSPWLFVDWAYVNQSDTCLVGELQWADFVTESVLFGDFPTNADANACFMTAAWGGDIDHDTLDNGDELLFYGTKQWTHFH